MSNLLEVLKREQKQKISGGIYHKVQIELTYNSNHIEGSQLSHDQTKYIYETNTIGVTENEVINVDDIIETTNHFRCIDFIIENCEEPLSDVYIKKLHSILMTGTSNSKLDWFNIGEYKRLPNEVGGKETTKPELVEKEINELIKSYNLKEKTLETIIEFHYKFETIHPFQDGNGRVGRLIMFKECLKNDIVPFIIGDDLKFFYYRGLNEWEKEKGYLFDTCLTCQDRFGKFLEYFEISFTLNL